MIALAKGFVGFYVARLRKNYPGYFREFYPYILLSLTAASLDFLSTMRFMVAYGVQEEAHPVIRMVSIFAGPVIGPLFGKICQLMALGLFTIAFRPFARVIFVPVIVVCFYAAWYNTWGINIYTPLFLRLISH